MMRFAGLRLSSRFVARIQVAHLSSVTRAYPVGQVLQTLRHCRTPYPQGWVPLAFNLFRCQAYTRTTPL